MDQGPAARALLQDFVKFSLTNIEDTTNWYCWRLKINQIWFKFDLFDWFMDFLFVWSVK